MGHVARSSLESATTRSRIRRGGHQCPKLEQTEILIEYESFGRDSDPALLLVSGWSVQMLAWDEALCRRLAGLGLRVIRFDNRDCGLSTHFDGLEYDLLAAAAAQLRGAALPVPPYRLSDMADDAIGLLDALGIERAHVAGASMGGMIAQRIAIAYPARVLSLISIMSNTGEPGIGDSTPEALAALFTPPPTTRDAYVDHIAKVALVIGSKTHFDEGAVRARALAGFDRAYYPEGADPADCGGYGRDQSRGGARRNFAYRRWSSTDGRTP
jgi:pimeloyl-ACP methyl ester carboxylesterase